MNKKITDKKSNLHIWKNVEVTQPSWLKSATINGNKIKAVNPQKQLKQATELFGPYGSTWGLKNCKRTVLDFENTVKLLFLECTFFYPGGEFEISNSIQFCYTSKAGRYIVDDEAPKKVETNTISKALSKLGFASDVFEGRFDQHGYEKTVAYSIEKEISQAEINGASKLIKQQLDIPSLTKIWNSKKNWHQNKEIFDTYKETLTTLQALKQ